MTGLDAARVPVVSPVLLRWFTWYARRFLCKHMHAVRLLRAHDGAGVPAVPPDEPVIVCCNHPSWWDPMVGIFLASHLWPARSHYWPIDAKMLARYRFFSRLGFFGVERGGRQGARTFLRTATAALSRGDACLWVTAEGQFSDVRARPVRVKPGIVHLARRLGRGVILPLAVEYPFWTEKTPEVLLAFGRPVPVAERPGPAGLGEALTGAMDELAAAAMARDPGRFATLLAGAAGTSRVYDAWRRGRALLAGGSFDPSHMPEAGPVRPRPGVNTA
jgi:1-acyl-sn-glycerol-3-phosphate acyltransferase